MGLFSESIAVNCKDTNCNDTGQPQYVQWKGTQYTVTNEPVRWYERRQWWLEENRAPLGSGAGLVDHEIWRVQLIPSTAEPGTVHTITLDLVRHMGSGRWRLLRIHDAAPSRAEEPEEAA